MATTAQTFYPHTTDQDQSWGTDVRKLDTASPATNSFTVTFTNVNGSTPYLVTVDPYTNKSASATDDLRTNLGWAWNEDVTDADAMDSETTSLRKVLAGTWSFQVRLNCSAPALLQSYDVFVEFSVYRVATGGGTRTLLFSMNSGTTNVNTTSNGEFTFSASGSQSAIALQAGETMHVAYRISARATAPILGGTTNSIITFYTGTQTSVVNQVVVAPPGIRTNYIRGYNVTGKGTVTKDGLEIEMEDSVTGDGNIAHSKAALVAKEFNVIGDGNITETHPLQASRIRSVTGIGLLTYDRVTIAAKEFNVVGVGDVKRAGLIIILLDRNVTGMGNVTYTRDSVVSKNFNIVGTGTISNQKALEMEDSVIGTGTITDQKIVVLTDFNVVGDGNITFTKAVIAAKDFDIVGTGTISHQKSQEIERSLVGTGTITNLHPLQAFRERSVVGVGEILVTGPNASTILLPIDELPTGEVVEVGGDTVIFAVLD